MDELEIHLSDRWHRSETGPVGESRLLGLATVELNPTELCNRTCSFCPRVDPAVYPNRTQHMDPALAQRIAAELEAAGFRGEIHVAGFGEPLLHPDLTGLVRTIRSSWPRGFLEITTNGDRLSIERLQELLAAGVDRLLVNCYDGPAQLERRAARFQAAGIDPSRYRFRRNFDQPEEPLVDLMTRYGFTNRAGALATTHAGRRTRPCHLPFYKMFLDWNGDVLLCCNDWLRRHDRIGNVQETPLVDVWNGPALRHVRGRLIDGDRSGPACRNCDIDGTRVGGRMVELWRNELERTSAAAVRGGRHTHPDAVASPTNGFEGS